MSSRPIAWFAVMVALFAGFAIRGAGGSLPPLTLSAEASPPYVIHDLGTLPGGTNSVTTAINDEGQIVGWSTNASGATRAVLWDQGAIADLGDLGGGMSTATDINDEGQIVGESTNAAGDHHAFLWQGGAMTDLGTLPGGFWSRATGINEEGQIVGWSADGTQTRPFLWQDGIMTDFGIPSETASWPTHRAAAINEGGQIVVLSEGGGPYGIDVRTFVWQANTWTDVSDPYGAPRVIGADINDRGQVAGWSSGYTRFTAAWVWEQGVFTYLGTLGGNQPEAQGMNEAGRIVGYDQAQGGPLGVGHGFFWKKGVMTDLGTLVDGRPTTASAINDEGDIVGWAYASQTGLVVHAVLWTMESP